MFTDILLAPLPLYFYKVRKKGTKVFYTAFYFTSIKLIIIIIIIKNKKGNDGIGRHE